MKSDLMLLGAVGAVIALVVAYAMMGQGQKTSVTTSKKRSFDQTITDPKVFSGEAVLVADDPNPASQFATHNVAGLTETFAHLAQGGKLEGPTAEVASKLRKVASVADNVQYTLGVTDEQRQKLEAAAMQKALAAAKLLRRKSRRVAFMLCALICSINSDLILIRITLIAKSWNYLHLDMEYLET